MSSERPDESPPTERVYRCLDTTTVSSVRVALAGFVDPDDIVQGFPAEAERGAIALRPTTFVASPTTTAVDRATADRWIALLLLHGVDVRRATVPLRETVREDIAFADARQARLDEEHRERVRIALTDGGEPVRLSAPADSSVPLDEAQDTVERSVGRFLGDASRLALAASVGLGKSEAALRQAAVDARFRGRVGLYAAPSHALCEELVERYNALRSDASPIALHWRGRTGEGLERAGDGEQSMQPMCERRELADELGFSGLSVRQHLCGGSKGGSTCPLRDVCRYMRQERERDAALADPRGVIIFMPHSYLGLSADVAGPLAHTDRDADYVVVDESFWQELVQERPTVVSTEDLRALREVCSAKGRREENKTAALSEASTWLAPQLEAGASLSLGALARRMIDVSERHNLRGGNPKADPARRALRQLAGAEYQVARGHRARLSEMVSPTSDDGEALKGLRDSDDRRQLRVSLARARLWKTLAEEVERRDVRDTCNTVVAHANDNGEYDHVRIHWAREIRAFDPRRTPVLALDATADDEILRQVLPTGGDHGFETVRVRAEDRHTTATQLIAGALGKTNLEKALKEAKTPAHDDDRPKRRRSKHWRPNNLADVVELLRARVAAGKRVGIITHKSLEGFITEQVPEVAAAHFGQLRGLDRMNGVDELFDLGRPQPGPSEIDRLTRALFGATTAEVLRREDADPTPTLAGVRTRDGSPAPVMAQQPRGRLQRRVMWQIREAELLQAVGRARLARRDADRPCHVWLLTNIPIDITVDRTVRLSDHGRSPLPAVAPDRTVRSVSRTGVLLRSARDLSEAHPDLWANPQAVKDERKEKRRRGGEQSTLAGELVADILGAGRIAVRYRRKGARGTHAEAVVAGPEKGWKSPYKESSCRDFSTPFSEAEPEAHARAMLQPLVGELGEIELVQQAGAIKADAKAVKDEPEPTAAEILAEEPDLAAMHDAGIVAVCDVVDGHAVVPLGDGLTIRLPTASTSATMILGEGELAVLRADVDAGPDDDPLPAMIDATSQDRAAA